MIDQITPGQPHNIGSAEVPLLPIAEAVFWVVLVVLVGLALIAGVFAIGRSKL